MNKHLRMKFKTILILILFMTISGIIFYVWDYRYVKLEYIGSITIQPPLAELLSNKEPGLADKWKGVFAAGRIKDLKERWSIGPWLVNFKDNMVVNIGWSEVAFDDNEIYYACVGCEIEKIQYVYHSRYTNTYSDPFLFGVTSISLRPNVDESIIMIYKGDVLARDIGY